MTIFVYSTHLPYPRLTALGKSLGVVGRVANRLNRRVDYRQNPRSWEYMRDAAGQLLGPLDPSRVYSPDQLANADWKAVDRVVLLWRDGNGLGWSVVEKQVMALACPGTRITICNGRRRVFDLTPQLLRQYRWRRFLEKTLAADLVALTVFVIATPILVAVDLGRGKR